MKTLHIGWIGLGNMGTPMVLNLVKAGFNINVYNRTEEKIKPVSNAGAKACKSIDELCRESNVIFTMLSNDDAVESVFSQLINLEVKDKLFINMSTISPDLAIMLSNKCKAKECNYLDAPVSGSVKPATDGALLILTGGEIEDYNRALPMFEKLGKLSLLLGEAGQGSKAKLAINFYMSVVIEGLAETVLFAENHGIDRERMMQIINESACGSPMSKMKTPSIINEDYPVAFPLKYMLKDVRLAQDEGLKSELSHAMENAYQKAVDNELGNSDLMAVIKAFS